jgi:hypothetical protein
MKVRKAKLRCSNFKKIAISACFLASASTFAQMSGTLETGVNPNPVRVLPPVNLSAGMGFETNMDGVDLKAGDDQIYKNVVTQNLAFSTKFSPIANVSNALSIKGKFFDQQAFLTEGYEGQDRSDDSIKNLHITNKASTTIDISEKLALTPYIGAEYRKYYKHYYAGENEVTGNSNFFRRKRDYVSAAIGMSSASELSNSVSIAADTSLTFRDHHGNYTGRPLEADRDEDFMAPSLSVTPSIKLSSQLTLSMPLLYSAEIYRDRLARFRGNKSEEMQNGKKVLITQNEKLQMHYKDVGLNLAHSANGFNTTLGYTFHREDDKFVDAYDANVSIVDLSTSYDTDALTAKAGINYEYWDYDYENVAEQQIYTERYTNYVAGLVIKNIFATKINAELTQAMNLMNNDSDNKSINYATTLNIATTL